MIRRRTRIRFWLTGQLRSRRRNRKRMVSVQWVGARGPVSAHPEAGAISLEQLKRTGKRPAAWSKVGEQLKSTQGSTHRWMKERKGSGHSFGVMTELFVARNGE